MKQFIFFMIQAMYTIVANIIDDEFANKMSFDSIIINKCNKQLTND